MMGIPVEGHPNLAADPDGRRLGGPPAAQGLPDRRRAGPLLGGGVAGGVCAGARRRSTTGSRIPSADPDACCTPERPEPRRHPHASTSGRTTRPRTASSACIVDLHGEDVVGLEAIIGYLHTGFEKNMEQKSCWKAITYARGSTTSPSRRTSTPSSPRSRSCSQIEVPPKAMWMRTLLLELNRIHSHLIWLGTGALEIGAIGAALVLLQRPRPRCSTSSSSSAGRACTRGTSRPAASPRTSRAASSRECRTFCDGVPGVDRHVRDAADEPEDLARADARARAPVGRRRDRARPVGAGAARVGRRLGPAARRALPRVPGARLRRARLLRAATSTTATGSASTRCASR